MTAFALALVPAIVLMVYIYKKDKKEKEPIKLLWKCFFWGVMSSVPAIILEEVGTYFLEDNLVPGSIKHAFVDGFIIAAVSEEFCKYIMLKKCTWRSREFNCSFDGIVYAVFVSLGFAALENIFYVIDGGISIALLRMFTAVPLHAFDAVFMGYHYSNAKEAAILGSKYGERRNKRKALLVPIILHGLYDFLLSMDSEVVGDGIFWLAILVWVVFTIGMFIVSLKLVNKVSKRDDYFVPEVEPIDQDITQ